MRNVEDVYPLSPLQESLLFHALSAPRSRVGFERNTTLLRGAIDRAAFEAAWQQLVDRHPILRTAFVADGVEQPLQVVRRRVRIEIVHRDLRWLAPADRRRARQSFLDADVERGFELHRAPLMRLALLRLEDDRHELVWSFHHLLLDAWCRSIALDELFVLYEAGRRGERPRLAPCRPYRDYIAWLQRQDAAEAKRFWSALLAGLSGPTPLAISPAVGARGSGGDRKLERSVALSESLSRELVSFARDLGVTVGTLVFGAWALLLARYAGGRQVVFGVTVSGRPADLPGVESILGVFVNNVPLPVEVVPDQPLAAFLAGVQERLAAIRQHEHCAPSQLLEWSGWQGGRRLFESLVLFQNVPLADVGEELAGQGLRIDGHEFRLDTSYPITLRSALGRELVLDLRARAERFDAESVERVSDDLRRLIESMLGAEGRPLSTLSVLGPAQRGELLAEAPRQGGRSRREAGEARRLEGASAPPATPLEEMLCELWQQLLGVERVGREDNLFDHGLYSLAAIQLISRLREMLAVELPLRSLFSEPTVAAMAERIERALRGGGGLERGALEPVPRDGELPLSFAQERLWLMYRMQPSSAAYNVARAVRLEGRLEPLTLRRVLTEIVRRHEALRTCFPSRLGRPEQRIEPPAPVALPAIDLTALAPVRRDGELVRLARGEARRPFDLERGPLLRVHLLVLGRDHHAVLLNLHHVVTDAWSTGVLVRELAALYPAMAAGEEPPLPELRVQYADFASWQRRWLSGEVLDEQLAYWERQLRGAPLSPRLPTERPGSTRRTLAGEFFHFRLSPEVSRELRALSRGAGVTLFMTLLAGFKVLLHRLTGETDVVVGTDVANRNRAELEGLIGFFVNNLVLRTDLSGNPTFRELLGRVRETTLGAFAHQDLPFDELVRELAPAREPGQTPLFQVLCVLQNAPQGALELPGLKVTTESYFRESKFDLSLFFWEGVDELWGVWCYSTELFDAAAVSGWSRQLAALLASVARDPEARLSQLEIEDPEQKQAREDASQGRQRARLGRLGKIRAAAEPGDLEEH